MFFMGMGSLIFVPIFKSVTLRLRALPCRLTDLAQSDYYTAYYVAEGSIHQPALDRH